MAEDRKWNGGKFPNRETKGLALEEFIDSAGVNSRSTAPGSPDESENQGDRKEPMIGKLLGNVLKNPTVILAGIVVLPALLVTWLLTRRRKSRSDRDENPQPKRK